MDSTRINQLGWQAKTDLQTGLAIAYAELLKSQKDHQVINS
jgi:GDP-L-fucose synthase